jgi:hypothetical protein
MTPNHYDQACRFHAKLDPPGFLRWAFELPASDLAYRRWLDTRLIPFPGAADRFCDTVAHVEDVIHGHVPWAVVVEFQIEPDSLMFGRLLGYLGQLWLELKPTDLPGDRYNLTAVVVNLTGRGNSARAMSWPAAKVVTNLTPREINLSECDAQATLDAITVGNVAPVMLPYIPLMQGGGDPGIIQQWLGLASAEPDEHRRGDYGGLAEILADAAGCRPAWKQALKGWNMVQSQVVLEWIAQGKAEGKAEDILRLLELRFQTVPSDLVQSIQATTDVGQLRHWFDAAATAASLSDFRQAAGL